MKTRFTISILCGILIFITAGCATLDSAKHKHIMRGQILDVVDGGGVYLCIGSRDGVAVGQEFSVHKFVRIKSQTRSEQYSYQQENTGTVKITEVVDEHYAKAKIIAGEAKVNYIVELK